MPSRDPEQSKQRQQIQPTVKRGKYVAAAIISVVSYLFRGTLVPIFIDYLFNLVYLI